MLCAKCIPPFTEKCPTKKKVSSSKPVTNKKVTVRLCASKVSEKYLSVEAPYQWKGTIEEALQTSSTGLSPVWKVFLLSDGSVTRHLQLLTGGQVTVELLATSAVNDDEVPKAAQIVEGPKIQRQVLLRSAAHPSAPLVYASSWWSAAQINAVLKDTREPIWVSLSRERTELYRELLSLECGRAPPELETLLRGDEQASTDRLRDPSPLWGRYYVFWRGGKPLTVIYEVFSNQLQQYLGPVVAGTVAASLG